MPYFMLTSKDRTTVKDAYQANLEKLLVTIPMRLVNFLLFSGRRRTK